MMSSMHTRTLREAMAVAVAASALGLAANAVRPGSLALVARSPYEVLVPCPEPGGPVAALEPREAAPASPRTFVIDARDGAAFAAGHVPGAVSVPYDWLDPVPEARLRELARAIAASRATRVVVYGDGGRPDSGEHLGREISGRGIRNVAFVRGGAAALLSEGGR
jgi:rhodanese-related sulfurtransferase